MKVALKLAYVDNEFVSKQIQSFASLVSTDAK